MEDLTPNEERIMQILWKLEKAFVKDILAHIEDVPKPPYNTVSSIVRLLEKKGYVSYRAYGKTYEYFPSLSKEVYTKTSFAKLVSGYFESSPKRLLSYILREESLSSDDIAEMKRMIEKKD